MNFFLFGETPYFSVSVFRYYQIQGQHIGSVFQKTKKVIFKKKFKPKMLTYDHVEFANYLLKL